MKVDCLTCGNEIEKVNARNLNEVLDLDGEQWICDECWGKIEMQVKASMMRFVSA